MSSNTAVLSNDMRRAEVREHGDVFRFAVPVARVFFAAIFIQAGVSHFSPQSIGYAAQQGVPLASFLVPASGILAAIGGLSVLLGYRAKIGALAIALFLVGVTPAMHAFWAVDDPMMSQMHMAMFMKNLSMLGGALLIAWFGPGPLSVDVRAGTGKRSV